MLLTEEIKQSIRDYIKESNTRKSPFTASDYIDLMYFTGKFDQDIYDWIMDEYYYGEEK